MSEISVIIPAYQAEKTIAACLDSIATQRLRPHEVIVVDDGSTDATVVVAKTNSMTTRVISRPHQGAAEARNVGAAEAAGDLLFFCDADVTLDSRALEQLDHALASHPDAAFAYCSFRWGQKVFRAEPFDVDRLRRNNSISTMSLIRKKDFPGFDTALERFQDWDVWLTLAAQGKKGVAVPHTLFSVQLGGRMSHRGGLSRLRATRIIRQKHHLPAQVLDYVLAIREWLRV